MKFKAAIFDLDGTLVDSLSDIADSMNRVLSLHGFPIHPLSDYRQFIGDGMRVLVTRALPEGLSDSKLIDLCLSQMKDEYSRNWNCKTRVYGEIPQLLKYLSDKGLVLSVLSNKPHEFTVKVIEHYFGNSVFKEILGAGNFRKTGSFFSPEYCPITSDFSFRFFIPGRFRSRYETAKSAGMFACGCLWGFREKRNYWTVGQTLLLRNRSM